MRAMGGREERQRLGPWDGTTTPVKLGAWEGFLQNLRRLTVGRKVNGLMSRRPVVEQENVGGTEVKTCVNECWRRDRDSVLLLKREVKLSSGKVVKWEGWKAGALNALPLSEEINGGLPTTPHLQMPPFSVGRR